MTHWLFGISLRLWHGQLRISFTEQALASMSLLWDKVFANPESSCEVSCVMISPLQEQAYLWIQTNYS